MKRLFPLFFLFLAACGAGDTGGPYGELLNAPPYASLTDSIRKSPDESELYFRRAVLLNSNQQTQPALADFRKAWSLDPQEKYAMGIGNLWLTTRPDSAAAFVEKALEQLPQSLFLKLLLARAYEGAGRIPDALKTCDEIISESPGQVNALILKAELQQSQGNHAAAVSTLEKAYALLPGNRQLAEELAYEYAETKNPGALRLADSLIQKDSLKEHASPFYIKGNYYTNINDRVNAIRWYDETIRRDHRYLNAYIEKGKIYFNDGQTDKALATFQLANTISPAFPDAWYWIGRCQEKMGDKKEAKLSYQKAWSLDQSFMEAKEAAERI